jgi:hypothetical protein
VSVVAELILIALQETLAVLRHRSPEYVLHTDQSLTEILYAKSGSRREVYYIFAS